MLESQAHTPSKALSISVKDNKIQQLLTPYKPRIDVINKCKMQGMGSHSLPRESDTTIIRMDLIQ